MLLITKAMLSSYNQCIARGRTFSRSPEAPCRRGLTAYPCKVTSRRFESDRGLQEVKMATWLYVLPSALARLYERFGCVALGSLRPLVLGHPSCHPSYLVRQHKGFFASVPYKLLYVSALECQWKYSMTIFIFFLTYVTAHV
jgi:hypothetical protein